MSTRAVYTFIDSDDSFHVYKHCDGYPQGALVFIGAALDRSWGPGRFEAGEAAAAFVAANKTREGDVHLTRHHRRHGDLAYRYEIRAHERMPAWTVRVYEVGARSSRRIFAGSLGEMTAHFGLPDWFKPETDPEPPANGAPAPDVPIAA